MAALWLKFRALPGFILPLILGITLIFVPYMGLGYAVTRQIQLTILLALIVTGLNLSLGYAGELAMGQVAMYAGGAYTAGLMSKAGVTDIFLQLIAGATVALLIGLISGIPGLRLGGWSLAMTSFFLILLIPDVLSIFKEQTGGRNGMTVVPATILGAPLDPATYYVLLCVIAIVWFAVMRNIIVSRNGLALQVLKRSPVLASSMGISVFSMKLSAYALGAIPAGVAGVLFANLDGYISPEAFAFSFAMTVLAASIFGGSASVYGAAIGAAVLQFGLNQASNLGGWNIIITGAFLVFGGVVFTGGLAGLGRSLVKKIDNWANAKAGTAVRTLTTDSSSAANVTIEALNGAPLVTNDVSKAFGGNQALANVSVDAQPGKVTAIIGPNGSGKTTLLNMISGFYKTDSGSISLDKDQIAGLPSFRVSRAGVARTFQTPHIPEKLSVFEAVEAGRIGSDRVSIAGAIFRTPKFLKVRKNDRIETDRALALVGLSEQRDMEADALPLGQRRLLEVARALVANPRVLLLDETASGLDEDELDVLEALIRRLRDAGLTVVLVEHNFQLVLRLADTIYVLAQGKVMASGTSEEIENNPRVKEEYLGIAAEVDVTSGESDV